MRPAGLCGRQLVGQGGGHGQLGVWLFMKQRKAPSEGGEDVLWIVPKSWAPMCPLQCPPSSPPSPQDSLAETGCRKSKRASVCSFNDTVIPPLESLLWPLNQAQSFGVYKKQCLCNQINLQIPVHFSYLDVRQKQAFSSCAEKWRWSDGEDLG